MLSALSHHINKLDEKFDDQEQEINRLKLRDSICDCSPELSALRSQVKENKIHIDELLKKMELLETGHSFHTHGCDKKTSFPKAPQIFQYDDRNRPSCVPTGMMRSTGECGQPVRYTPNQFFSSFSNYQPETNDLNAGHSTQGRASQPVKLAQSYTGSANNSVSAIYSTATGANHSNSTTQAAIGSGPGVESTAAKSVTAWNCQNDAIKQPPSPRKGQQIALESPKRDNISLNNIHAIAAENSGLRNQLVSYRKKIEGLEQALAGRDLTIDDLRAIKEHYAQKEREWEQRQDWLDHKMKLLKQDKRRRGETIGKLLKVIDDLKESGRLDESKVKDGRAVLSMTLQTKDLQPDERISRVVDAVEFDRVPRCPTVETPVMVDGGCHANENCNNSRSNCADCYNCTCTGRASYVAMQNSERLGFVPIPYGDGMPPQFLEQQNNYNIY